MNLIPSLTSGCNGACRSPILWSLLFIDLQVTTLVLLSTSAPAKIISAKVRNGLGFVACKYSFEQIHSITFTKPMSKSKAYIMSCQLPALFEINPIASFQIRYTFLYSQNAGSDFDYWLQWQKEKIFQNGPGLYFIAVFKEMTSIVVQKSSYGAPEGVINQVKHARWSTPEKTLGNFYEKTDSKPDNYWKQERSN